MDGSLDSPISYLARIWQLRYFWASLVKRDLDTRYKRSFLGLGWSLLRPLAMTFIFCVVFGKLLGFQVQEYAPYLLVGMTVWQFLTESMLNGCHAFTAGSAYIRQQPVPLAIFPLRTVLGASVHFAIALLLALVLATLFRGSIRLAGLLSLVPALALLFSLGWFLATLSSVLNTHFPDTKYILEIVLQVMFYATPIIYKPDSLAGHGIAGWISECNPLTAVLELVRTPMLTGAPPDLAYVQIAVAFVACLGVAAVALLRRYERELVFWV